MSLRELTTQWVLPANISSQLETYYILYWDYEYFCSQQCMNAGEIIHHGVHYTIVSLTPNQHWHNCKRVALSFRKEKHHEQGFVLVQPVA